MKLSYISLTLATLGTAAAQGVGMSGLPDCAKDCATGSIPKSCSLIDVECICSTQSFITDISCCVKKACSDDDQQSALHFANQICGGAGVHDLPKSASCAAGASATETSSGSSTSATDSTASSTASSSSTPSSSQSSADAAPHVHSQGSGIYAAAGAALFAFLA